MAVRNVDIPYLFRLAHVASHCCTAGNCSQVVWLGLAPLKSRRLDGFRRFYWTRRERNGRFGRGLGFGRRWSRCFFGFEHRHLALLLLLKLTIRFGSALQSLDL